MARGKKARKAPGTNNHLIKIKKIKISDSGDPIDIRAFASPPRQLVADGQTVQWLNKIGKGSTAQLLFPNADKVFSGVPSVLTTIIDTMGPLTVKDSPVPGVYPYTVFWTDSDGSSGVAQGLSGPEIDV